MSSRSSFGRSRRGKDLRCGDSIEVFIVGVVGDWVHRPHREGETRCVANDSCGANTQLEMGDSSLFILILPNLLTF